MLKLLGALCLASVVAGEKILDTHDASMCSEDDGSETDGCCSNFLTFCDGLYDVTTTGTCSNGKEKFTCICDSDDIFCNDNWDAEWDAEWDEAGQAVATAFWTTILLVVLLPLIICIIICVCCCFCNKTCCFEQKMQPMMAAPQQQAPP